MLARLVLGRKCNRPEECSPKASIEMVRRAQRAPRSVARDDAPHRHGLACSMDLHNLVFGIVSQSDHTGTYGKPSVRNWWVCLMRHRPLVVGVPDGASQSALLSVPRNPLMDWRGTLTTFGVHDPWVHERQPQHAGCAIDHRPHGVVHSSCGRPATAMPRNPLPMAFDPFPFPSH